MYCLYNISSTPQNAIQHQNAQVDNDNVHDGKSVKQCVEKLIRKKSKQKTTP